MNSVRENKNELEAAVRYCESAISRAKQTIESMEFRQQAATKAWHEQTGREESLNKRVEFLTKEYNSMKDYADRLLDENVEVAERNDELKIQLVEERDRSMGYTKEAEELKTNMALMTDELEQRISEVADLKVQQQAMEQTMQLQKDQIAMFQRKMSRMNEMEK